MNGQMIERMNERMNKWTKGNKQGSEGRYFVVLQRTFEIDLFTRFSLYLKKRISKSLEKNTVRTVRLSASVIKIYEIYLKDEYINIKILIIYSLVIL